MRQVRETYCSLCGDSGFATVWHWASVEAFRRDEYDRRRHMRGMAVACSCRAGERFRGGHVSFAPSQHCPYPTMMDDREPFLAAWCEEHFGNTVEMRNGIQIETRY